MLPKTKPKKCLLLNCYPALLKNLMANETAYLSYFWWKDYYEVTSDKNGSNPPLVEASYCRLCELLNDPDRPQKVWDNLNKWWSTRGHCRKKGSYQWSKYRDVIQYMKIILNICVNSFIMLRS